LLHFSIPKCPGEDVACPAKLKLACCPELLLVQEEAVVVLDLETKELEIHDLGAGGLGD
jgi:hypothetical protein